MGRQFHEVLELLVSQNMLNLFLLVVLNCALFMYMFVTRQGFRSVNPEIWVTRYLRFYCTSILHSKMVGCAVNVDRSFVQCWNREYRTANKTTLLNSTYIIPSHINVNKQLAVE